MDMQVVFVPGVVLTEPTAVPAQRMKFTPDGLSSGCGGEKPPVPGAQDVGRPSSTPHDGSGLGTRGSDSGNAPHNVEEGDRCLTIHIEPCVGLLMQGQRHAAADFRGASLPLCAPLARGHREVVRTAD